METTKPDGRSSEQYMKDMGIILTSHNYQKQDGTDYNCGDIANEIACRLLGEGKEANVKVFPKIGENLTLKPQMLSGVEWGRHQAVECDGMIFDPLIGKPLNEKDYVHQMFGTDVTSEVLTPSNSVSKWARYYGFMN